ncbi:MAG: hypothetical protein WAM73_16790, partial [Desulfobacterales bacterium]
MAQKNDKYTYRVIGRWRITIQPPPSGLAKTFILKPIVSSDAYNSQRPNVIIIAVTSQMRAVDYTGGTTIAEWQAAGLLKPSV